jgi:hypothetical protein
MQSGGQSPIAETPGLAAKTRADFSEMPNERKAMQQLPREMFAPLDRHKLRRAWKLNWKAKMPSD